MNPSQKQTIIQLLNGALWVCGIDFQMRHIPEYRTRINELRKEGFTIETRKSQQHRHKGIMQEWHLALASSDHPTVKSSDASQDAPQATIQLRPVEVPTQPKYSTYLPPCCAVWEQSHYMHAQSCINAIK
jgi:hypothetical protein